jgi:LmbE family N-acetylglucosaminyl deacetylase
MRDAISSSAVFLPALLMALRILFPVGCHATAGDLNSLGTPQTSGSHGQVVAVLAQAKRVLWLGAHPDDENSASALLARAKDMSGSLFLVSLTSGENSDMVWAGLRRGSEIGAARAKLFARAAALLRADGAEVGPFVNGPLARAELDGLPRDAPHRDWPAKTVAADVLRKWRSEGDPLGYVITTLRRFRPDVVIAMDGHCGVSGHPEHRAVGRVLLDALPLAADDKLYKESGPAWQVGYVIFTASVIPDLMACGYCKCEGPHLPEPVEQVPAVERSPGYAMTYFGLSCLVARSYENEMKGKRSPESKIRSGCQQAEELALQAVRQGRKHPEFAQPFRVQPILPSDEQGAERKPDPIRQ